MSIEPPSVEEIYASDPKLLKDDVKEIFDWMKEQPHLPEITEFQAILFLHSCWYNLQHAKDTIENYFSFKNTSSRLCDAASEELIRKTLRSLFIALLPKRTPDDCAVGWLKLIDTDPEKYDCEAHMQLMMNFVTLYFHEHGPVNGYYLVLDSEGISFGHLFKISISALRQFMFFAQEASPIRIKGIHFVNCAPITKHVIALLKPMLKKEVYESIRVHSESIKTIYEYIPRKCLPKEYGGKAPTMEEINSQNMEHLIENLGFLRKLDAQKTDESKRIARSRLKGIAGTIQGLFWRN